MMDFFGPEEGHYALALACVLALFQGIAPFLKRQGRPSFFSPLTPGFAWAHALALLLAFMCLMLAALRDDFSVQNIAENSALAKPLFYKITGIWGNHEGSILLWIVLLGLCSACVSFIHTRHQNTLSRLKRHALGVLGLISAGFDLFCLLTSNPFARLFPMPADGMGMNPLLQDPGLAVHPPLLYAGYVGFVVPFAFAIAALIDGQLTRLWATLVRPWVLVAWALLTCGIALGSWWSYYVLGWGGYWFWDPVENASLIPWLSGTALLHSILVVEKRQSLRIWTALLALATFSFSLSGTFLVRSGILNSVHSFANDPTRGVFILTLLALVVGGALTLFAWRAPSLHDESSFTPLSRESALVLNTLFLCTLCAVVLTGTLYPPFIQLLLGHTLSVGKPFFDSTTIPLTIPLLIAMGIGPALPWLHGSLRTTCKRLYPAFLCTCAACIPAFVFLPDRMAALCAVLALWVISSSVLALFHQLRVATHPFRLSRKIWGMTLAHIGVGVTILGLCGMSAAHHTIVASRLGEHQSLDGLDWQLVSVTDHPGPNYDARVAELRVSRHGHPIAQLHPALRVFSHPHQTISQVAIRSFLTGDLYAVLGSTEHEGQETRYILRLHHNPLAPWIWLGGLIMAGGGLMACPFGRKRTQGTPS